MTDRGFWVAGLGLGGNVRRLMYQSLIWVFVAGDDARRLCAPLDTEDAKRLPDPLIDGVRRDVELGRNLLRIEVLVDEKEAVELTGAELRYARGHQILRARITGLTRRIMRSVRIIQCNTHPTKHPVLPSRVPVSIYVIPRTLARFPLI
jgi:hypothetical protein